ncbi:type II inositol 3,4-bisphosphate 4-phosphatase isoform X1 [Gadus morhua]|uniref:type II inositol 3,4-bisphosphate 4-phosphatase isoform X1 n=1 Tax=Gadus morhua TaxID=8049 RepID=UPI0011B7E9B8|nr:type II inositol 3,4-bisphosphate 4-phosphatase-like isoform X1 [Gadus morhua]XP_030193519.1 type II inositol 3,4-bisphosphate 4-phosphatase-like isoform X1 [Gadus morhua]
MDGESEVEEKMSSLTGERGERTPPDYQCSVLCESLQGSVDDKEDCPLMRAVSCSWVSKVYRLPTETDCWMLVKEKMSESPLTFHIPTLLLDNLIKEEKARIKELNDLCDLSPDWDGLRSDIIAHCRQLIGWYEATVSELSRMRASSCFKSSQRKADRHLQFVPTNLHLQRMEVIHDPNTTGECYDVITVGAAANHHMSFKHGGLKRLISKHTGSSPLSFSPGEASRARALLASVAQLQPLIFGLSEEVLASSLELSPTRLQQALNRLAYQTEQFVHALKDELVRSTLLAIHTLSLAPSRGHAPIPTRNGTLGNHTSANQEGLPAVVPEYDEEDWDRTWANVAMSFNCLTVMMDRLLGREELTPDLMSSPQQEATSSYVSSYPGGSRQDQLLPLVLTLRECVREASQKAKAAMNVVLLQEALAASHHHAPALTHRRDAVFSQALGVLVCGVALKVYESLDKPEVLLQFHTAGVLVQFEVLLSTYGEEVGMLEDMEVGVSDLSGVAFCVTTATSDHPDHLLPTLRGTRGSLVVELRLPGETFCSLPQELQAGGLIRVCPVLFNIGINQNQSLAERFGDCSLQDRINQENCELLKSYCSTFRDTPSGGAGQDIEQLLSSLQSSIGSKKRKNVEVLWSAASVCRRVNGVRVTSCKSAKDRTAMSVTLEQCVLLRDEHTLRNTHFNTALDTMRRSHLSWGQMVACYARPCCSVPRVGPWVGAPVLGPQAPGCHLYPVIFLLVTSHLLVFWLIISLLVALDYQ